MTPSLLWIGLLAGCGTTTTEAPPEPVVESPAGPSTADDLQAFYDLHGGRDAFPAEYVMALEALLYGQDDLESGDRASARERVDAVFAEMPLSDPIWNEHNFFDGTNVGHPVAYYGLRQLDHILTLEEPQDIGTLTMTAVVATCASVQRPTLPDLEMETVDLDIDPQILDDNAALLHTATALFRSWVRAITGGMTVELEVFEMTECTTVTYTDDGQIIVSYPDANQMVGTVRPGLAEKTDFWWVVAPSGVPGDGSGYDRHFITGGMGSIGALPLFLSDDAWFTRKPEHLGVGPYTIVEVRAYQPQWFQHEFMHHLYRTWPEYELEVNGHDWFDRSTWPTDFVGEWEPDYYIESIDKRLLTADPSLADALSGPEFADLDAFDSTLLNGRYERKPMTNDWHGVDISMTGTSGTWSNDAGVSWSLEIRDGDLWTGPDCPYDEQILGVELDGGAVDNIWFGGEAYQRQ